MAVGRWWCCYVARCCDDSLSLLVMLYSLRMRCQFVAGGDVIYLGVEMAVGRWW
jgi:hypothetical protein